MTQLAPKPDPTDNPAIASQSKRLPWLGLVVGILIGAIATYVGGQFSSSQPEETSSAPTTNPNQAPGRAVTTLTLEPQAIAKTMAIVGTVTPAEIVAVTAARSGLQITNLLVDEGDNVQAGQLLAQLDNATLQAELRQAQAQVAQAQARLAELRAGARSEELARAQEQVNQARAALGRSQADLQLSEQRLQRNQELFEAGAIAADTLDETRTRRDGAAASVSQNQATLREAEQRLQELRRGPRLETLAQAEAQLQQAQAQVSLVTTRLRETQVRAPRSGKILEKFAQLGDLSTANEPLFNLLEAGQLELEANIPETQLNQVEIGQTVEITSDRDPNLQLTGQIQEIVPTVDRQSRQATLKISLPPGTDLKPGMFLRGNIILAQAQGLGVPTEAVIPQDGEQATVFRVNADDTVTAVTVQLGELLDNDQIEVLGGLQAGDRLVVKGAPYLKDGDAIEIQPFQ
ncbi:efflux RND transporter periplasmic adaptor subunit [Picosynechococcus sp. PCC 7117]|uniref:efflux RND transporter periplasmic adaptor subunit n=1 Tax=Picosynechococcus sp. PCC 7117 TaxID=195498 RepID=UPI0008108065|nr:efflux RND transporter periplasmic adaptor subunit [Picosynechococcus sp. PCC 7117]ANV88734.1 efflux transporter periplasmic adaptor subunit [Picosynechococcus sp. PCC 7117]